MKILILSQYWHPENGVPQRRWSWLSRILVDAGHEVTVIAPPPHYQRKVGLGQWFRERHYSSSFEPDAGPSGEKIVRSGFVPAGASLTRRILNQATVALGALWVVLKRPGALNGYRPDLVIGTVPALPTAVVSGLSARILKCPYIIDLRDAWPDLLEQSREWNKSTGKRSLRERFLTKGPFQLLSGSTRLALHKVMKGAAGLMVTSSDLQSELCTRPEIQSHGKVPKTVTIRNVFPPETGYLAERTDGGPSEQLNVLYAGTLGRAQNLVNAVEAACLAEKSGVRIHLRLVGAGAAREALAEATRATDVDISLEGRQPSDQLEDYYEWADTALVHLTDWEPLKRAVPSKTYELMEARLHISGVVQGEAAEIIRTRQAGDVVAPDEPQSLADLWVELAQNRSRLIINGDGPEWVARERELVVPPRLLELVEESSQSR